MGLGFVLPILAILVGVLSLSNLIIERRPNAKEIIEKIAKYQAAIGLAAALISLLSLMSINVILRMSFFDMLLTFVCMGACLVAGFILGFPLIQSFVLTDLGEEAEEKGEAIRKKLLPYHALAGLLALGTGVYVFIFVALAGFFK
ncbi:MAG: hypothetical protein MK212_02005 [Saprospiraceae bacterium]|nr:hypothetical protein [Saprospiraceae bacterium]